MTLDQITPVKVAQFRKESTLNEQNFWGKIGVTKATGNKYESGDVEMPDHIKIAVAVCYGPLPYKLIAQIRNETYVYAPAKRNSKSATASTETTDTVSSANTVAAEGDAA